MREAMKKMHARLARLFFLPLIAAAPTLLQAEQTEQAAISALGVEHKALAARLDALEQRLRNKVEHSLRDQVESWRLGLDDMGGAAYQQRLQQALQVAKSYGLDVERLRRLHDLTKAALLRAELVQPGARSITYTLGPSGLLAGFMDWANQEELRRAEAAAAAQSQRQELHRKVSLAYLEALLERDPAAAAARFRRYSDAVRQVLAADADQLLAEAEALAAELELVQTIGSGVPLLGDALDISAIAYGEHPLTGEEMNALDWGMSLLGVAIGPLGQLVHRIPAVNQTIGKLVALASEASAPIVAQGRYSAAQLGEFVRRFADYPEVQAVARAESRKVLAGASEQAIERFLKSADGSASEAAWEGVRAAGARKVDQLAELLGSADAAKLLADDATLAAYVAMRADKTAIARLKESDAALRGEVFRLEEMLYGKVVADAGGKLVNDGKGAVDERAIASLKEELAGLLKALPAAGSGVARASMDAPARAGKDLATALRAYAARIGMLTDEQVGRLAAGAVAGEAASATPGAMERLARHVAPRNPEETAVFRKNAAEIRRTGLKRFQVDDLVDADNLQIRVFNATNKPPKVGDIGADRDITYLLVLKDGTPLDIPAELVAKHYNEALYTTLNPQKKLPVDPEARAAISKEFAHRIDHTVTDGMALDAYRPGMAIGDFLGTGAAQVKASAAADVGATIAYKGDEWFQEGRKLLAAGSPRGWEKIGEGMRQLTKQYDNQIVSRLQARRLDETANVPPRLLNAIGVMKRVSTPAKDLAPGVKALSPAAAEAALQASGFRNAEEAAVALGE